MRNFRKIFVIFFVCMSDRFAFGNEPHCSKFHYEEKLLEKLVRMEFNMEQRGKELKEGLTELSRKQTEAQESNQVVLQEHEKEITAIQKENKELKEHLVDAVSHIGKQGDPPNKVLFKARQLKDTAPKSGGTLIFKEVLTNVGGGYDNSTGVFTSPADGVFLYTIHLCISTNKYCNYAIMVDGIKHTKGSIKNDNWGDCITAESIAIVKSGSRVRVENYGNAGFYDNENSFNHFSGIMIYSGQF
ncbi:EMILIN-2-like [Mya arenaria]|uniref:EMILIN-2-like n=1 Tax=Mya arenaria TaxID=6604 RepID=UPI0022E699AE|nr:EMILIN-2-like [Mya arenaria]